MEGEMKTLDLFSGIGGFSLAASWVWGEDHDIHAFVEIDPFCQKVLKKHWPDVPIISDIKEYTVDTHVSLWYDRLPKTEQMEVDMAAKRKNYDEAVRLYELGLSVQNVADFYQVSRQSMWIVLKRRGCVFRPNIKFGKENHFYRGGNRASDLSQNLLEEAIERGIVERKSKCDECGSSCVFSDGRTGIQAHHSDYNKPLDIMWLCQRCHHEWHKKNTAVERNQGEPITGADVDLLTGGFP